MTTREPNCPKHDTAKVMQGRRWRCLACRREIVARHYAKRRNDPAFRAHRAKVMRDRRIENSAREREIKARFRAKHRDRINAERRTSEYRNRNNARLRANPVYKARTAERKRARWWKDPEYAARCRDDLKRSRVKHRDRRIAEEREWRKNPAVRAKLAAEARNRRAADPEHARAIRARWRAADPERRKAEFRRENQRRRATPRGKIESRIRTQFRQALRRRAGRSIRKMKNRTFDLLGYTPDELVAHIERQFTDGMCWERFREIDIHHIKFASQFDLSTNEGVRECWALKNLRAMWRPDHQWLHSVEGYDSDV
jgi:hypothetical protein